MDLLDEMEMENALATGSEPASDDQSGPARRPGIKPHPSRSPVIYRDQGKDRLPAPEVFATNRIIY